MYVNTIQSKAMVQNIHKLMTSIGRLKFPTYFMELKLRKNHHKV